MEHDKKIKLYIAEEQQILRDAYLPCFASHARIELVGSSGDTFGEAVVSGANVLGPDVLLYGGRVLTTDTVDLRSAPIDPGCAGARHLVNYPPAAGQGGTPS